MLSYRSLAGNWPDSSWGTGFSARLEHEPPNFPASSLPLMRTFMPVIKTIALANQDCGLGVPCPEIGKWEFAACDIYNFRRRQVGFLPYLMVKKSIKWCKFVCVCPCVTPTFSQRVCCRARGRILGVPLPSASLFLWALNMWSSLFSSSVRVWQ